MPAIGRIANFSSLRKHRPMENQIYDSYFGAHDGVFCTHVHAYIYRSGSFIPPLPHDLFEITMFLGSFCINGSIL